MHGSGCRNILNSDYQGNRSKWEYIRKLKNRYYTCCINTIYSKIKGITLTMLSAYFINQETKSPEHPRFSTTIHVVIVYPLKRRCHHGPFSNPPLKSSRTSRAKLKIAPNLDKECPLLILSLHSFKQLRNFGQDNLSSPNSCHHTTPSNDV